MTIAIVVNNLNANLYVNQRSNYSALCSYAGGGVGLLAVNQISATNVSYTNARLWTL
jgi:hypothetical protein